MRLVGVSQKSNQVVLAKSNLKQRRMCGAGFLEYVLTLALVSCVSVGALEKLGRKLNNSLAQSNCQLSGEMCASAELADPPAPTPTPLPSPPPPPRCPTGQGGCAPGDNGTGKTPGGGTIGTTSVPKGK